MQKQVNTLKQERHDVRCVRMARDRSILHAELYAPPVGLGRRRQQERVGRVLQGSMRHIPTPLPACFALRAHSLLQRLHHLVLCAHQANIRPDRVR